MDPWKTGRIKERVPKLPGLEEDHEEGGQETLRDLRPPSRSSPVYSQSRHVILDPRKLAANRCVCALKNSSEIECYKMVRAQLLQRAREQGWNTFMITSALSGEGKTLTAVNLALALAMEFYQTVLLVDCDLRNQNIHRVMGFESNVGLAQRLTGQLDLKDVIVWPGIEKLTIISGGPPVTESAELLGSPEMRELFQEMKGRYQDRIILFDAPPLLERAEAMILTQMVDGVLVVVEAGRTTISDLRRALGLLPRYKLFGILLNRCKIPNHSRALSAI